MSSPPNGRWVCVDGVEGAGKTTLAQALAPEVGATLSGEFSDAPFGRALRDAVRSSPHYISASPVGQSMVFLGDFFELYDSEVAPLTKVGHTVLHDRGYLSKYSYQYPILAKAVGTTKASELLDMVLGLIPRPDLTFYLTAPLPILCNRLVARDGACDDRRQEFIEAADAAARERLRRSPELRHVVLDTNRPQAEVLAEALRALSSSLDD